MSEIFEYPCGCKFPITGKNADGSPLVSFDPRIEYTPLTCERTWDLISSGNTKGVFQLESRLGQKIAKELKPRNIEHLAALVAIMRPGCIAGDVKVVVENKPKKSGAAQYKRLPIRELFNQKHKKVMSVDEKTGELFHNEIIDVLCNGNQDVYKIKFRKNARKVQYDYESYYNLQCTLDHLLLTPNGWVELQDLKHGDRFAVFRRKGKDIINVFFVIGKKVL
jgi:hypothetical protein